MVGGAAIVVAYDGAGVRRCLLAAREIAAGKTATELSRGLDQGIRKVRTGVRDRLVEQMGVKRRGIVVAGTRSFVQGLTATIIGVGKGLPIREFPLRMSRSKGALARWSPREHWRLQGRDGQGRFGDLPDEDMPGAVSASPWRVARTFQRSFVDAGGEPRAMLPGGGRRRRLYGAGIAKEIVIGPTGAYFEAQAGPIIEPIILARLARIMP